MNDEAVLDTPAKQFLKRMAFGVVCVAGRKCKALCAELEALGLAAQTASGVYAAYYSATVKGLELLAFAGVSTQPIVQLPLL